VYRLNPINHIWKFSCA